MKTANFRVKNLSGLTLCKEYEIISQKLQRSNVLVLNIVMHASRRGIGWYSAFCDAE